MGNKKANDDANSQSFLHIALGFLKKNISKVALIVAIFLLCGFLSFMDIATRETVVSFSMDDYEIGQMAFKTIIADKNLPPDINSDISIEKGEKIIKKGFPITEEAYRKLEKMATTPTYVDYRAFGNNMLFLMLIMALWALLFGKFSMAGKKVQFKELLLQGVLLVVVYACTILACKTPVFLQTYTIPIIIPSALSVFFVAILFGQISANYYSFVLAMTVLLGSKFMVFPCLWTLATCLSAGRIVSKITNRIDLIFAALMLSILNAVYMVMFRIIFSDIVQSFVFALLGVMANGFLSGVLVLGLLVPLEQILNTASVFRLKDLDDVNSPVLRKLQLNAAGTYNHSLMVATLAQSACNTIGANGLVARIAAYYHDIGKIDQSEYFTENLAAGAKSAHADINPSLSISVIRSHVKKSVEKAHQMHLPQQVIDIIAEHHGNSVIESFYHAAAEDDNTVTPENCRYNGVTPTTRESAVVMLADVSEAACHSLENPTGPRIEKFIDTLVDSKAKHNQLDNCDLTFRDVAKVKATFVQILTGFYHTRIKYPGQKDPDTQTKNIEENEETPRKEEPPVEQQKSTKASKTKTQNKETSQDTTDKGQENGQ